MSAAPPKQRRRLFAIAGHLAPRRTEAEGHFRVSEPNDWTAIVEGLDISAATDPRGGMEVRSALRRLFAEHPVICVRGGSGDGAALEHEDYAGLVSIFGEIKLAEQELFRERKRRNDPNLRLEDVAPLLVMNSGRLDKDGNRTVANIWHTDDTFLEWPAMCTTLYAVELPSTGGDTEFINTQRGFETLDLETQKRIDGMKVVHGLSGCIFDVRHKPKYRKKNTETEPGDKTIYRPGRESGSWEHPLVRVHPVTKAKALYMKLEATKEIRGLSDDEARELLTSLRDHTEARGGKYSHAWRLHDVLIWDDLRVMHRAKNDFPMGEPRLMNRFLLRTMRTPEDESAEVRITGRKAAGY